LGSTWFEYSDSFTESDDSTTATGSISERCDFAGTTQGVCKVAYAGGGQTSTETRTFSEVTYYTFLVTAGADKLPSATAGATATGGSGAKPTGAASTGGPNKGAGVHMSPTRGGILAAILSWWLFGYY
jgi:hypothetical protein